MHPGPLISTYPNNSVSTAPSAVLSLFLRANHQPAGGRPDQLISPANLSSTEDGISVVSHTLRGVLSDGTRANYCELYSPSSILFKIGEIRTHSCLRGLKNVVLYRRIALINVALSLREASLREVQRRAVPSKRLFVLSLSSIQGFCGAAGTH